jgi:transketolase
MAEQGRPTLIRLRTVIGYGSPRAGTRNAHSDPFPEEQVRATKEALGWDPDAHFLVPDEVYAHWRTPVLERGAAVQADWQARFESWGATNPELAADWRHAWAGTPRTGFAEALTVFDPSDPAISTRKAASVVMQAFGPYVPTMVGGAADLVHSTFTEFEGDQMFTAEHAGRNVAWGVREHGMGAAVNGLALHGGIVKPYCSTFFVFTDYMRPPIRLSALMKLDVVWIFSHDSVAVGEDGPTHQPVEHLAAMRAIPQLTVIRPADANEASEAWGLILGERLGPVCLVLSRQNVAIVDRNVYAPASGLRKGAYVLADASSPDVVLVATGAEVGTALGARDLLAADGIQARVVSMPSWELFDAQSAEYRDSVLPADVFKLSVEAGSSFGWARYVDDSVAIDRFGESGKGDKVLVELGISQEAVAERVRTRISELAQA